MPTVGECPICGERQVILFGTVLEKTDRSGLRYVICCWTCREYFKEKWRDEHEHAGLGQA